MFWRNWHLHPEYHYTPKQNMPEMHTSSGGGEGASGCGPHQRKIKKKKTDFLDIIMSKVLCDIYTSHNQSLNTTDGYYTGILKNIKIMNKELFFFYFPVGFNFPCNLIRCRSKDFDMTFIT